MIISLNVLSVREINPPASSKFELIPTPAVRSSESGLIKERKLGDRRVIKMNGGYDKDLETCKLENDKLKDDNQKLRIYIQGLQSDNKMLFGNKKGKKTTA